MAHKTSCFAGSAGGLAKNFATLVEILGTYAEVKLPEKNIPLQTSRVSAGVYATANRIGIMFCWRRVEDAFEQRHLPSPVEACATALLQSCALLAGTIGPGRSHASNRRMAQRALERQSRASLRLSGRKPWPLSWERFVVCPQPSYCGLV